MKKPEIELGINNELSLGDISSRIEVLDTREIRYELEHKIKEHISLYNCEPYRISYSHKKNDYVVKANATIGLVNFKAFNLRINPKFLKLDIGKCLHLACYAKSHDLVKTSNNVCKKIIDEDVKLVGLDFFAYAFLTSVHDCINGGLLTSKNIIVQKDPLLRGKYEPHLHAKDGGNRNSPIVSSINRTYNHPLNRLLKNALNLCIRESKSEEIIGLCNNALSYFDDVELPSSGKKMQNHDKFLTLPRPDYKRASALANIINNGFSILPGDKTQFYPFFTLNLNELFEKYCYFELENTLKKDRFSLSYKKEFKHPFTPDLKSKFIAPDIILESNTLASRSIIIDTKNKFSISESGNLHVENEDLYQTFYYADVLGTDVVILLYPGDSINSSRYPLMGSEGTHKYSQKVERRVKEIKENGKEYFFYDSSRTRLHFIVWRVDLTGSLKNTQQSIAELCQFLSDVSKRKILN